MDLLLEDIGKQPWAKPVILKAKSLVTFIRKHQVPGAIFRKYSKLALIKPGDTRFATALLMVSRLVQVKSALLSMLNDDKYKAWADKPTNRAKAAQVCGA